jgi:delta1-piperideine-2-carboxylate reductase
MASWSWHFRPKGSLPVVPATPFDRAEALLQAITDQGARLPSARRFAARARSEVEGITLSEAEVGMLDRLLDLGLDAVS